jgi:hypothetical protein
MGAVAYASRLGYILDTRSIKDNGSIIMSRKKKYSASVWREGKWFVAQCLEVDVVSQGRSEAAALKNLADALALHFTPPVASLAPRVVPVEVMTAAGQHQLPPLQLLADDRPQEFIKFDMAGTRGSREQKLVEVDQ